MKTNKSELFLSVILTVAVAVIAIATFSLVIDNVSEGEVVQAHVFSAEPRDSVVLLRNQDPRSEIPAELLNELAAAK